MNRLLIAVCTALALCLFLAANASAHKVNIFAYADGDTVVTESGYSRSSRVQHGTVEVRNAADNELLLTGVTDEKGVFSFKIPEKAKAGKMDLLLLVNAGVGHKGDWTVKYDEYAGAAAAPAAPAEAAAPAAPAEAAAPAAVPAQADTAAIEAVVRREVAPIKQMLLEMHDAGPGVVEIVGGIGWIFGL
ncbi:hypothetical protein, partial [Pseudodesulfovibrio sp.]|uniref:hypothetical protein n=1 Tax=Pseudodesulfovibrio sp. TaxID=2035812 RepID=UPI002615810F